MDDISRQGHQQTWMEHIIAARHFNWTLIQLHYRSIRLNDNPPPCWLHSHSWGCWMTTLNGVCGTDKQTIESQQWQDAPCGHRWGLFIRHRHHYPVCLGLIELMEIWNRDISTINPVQSRHYGTTQIVIPHCRASHNNTNSHSIYFHKAITVFLQNRNRCDKWCSFPARVIGIGCFITS